MLLRILPGGSGDVIGHRIQQSFEKLLQTMALFVDSPSQAFPDLVAESVNAFLDRRLTLEQVIRELGGVVAVLPIEQGDKVGADLFGQDRDLVFAPHFLAALAGLAS